MTCAWVIAQARARGFNPSQYAVLSVLDCSAVDDVATLSKAAIGAIVGLKERQVANVIAFLVDCGLVSKERSGGSGKGRPVNSYRIATGNPVPEADCTKQLSAGNPVPALGRTQQPSTGIPLPVAATGNAPPTPPYITTTTSQNYPEPTSPSLEGVQGDGFALTSPAKAPRRRKHPKFVASDVTLPLEPTPEMIQIASERGMRNGTLASEFAQWRRWHIREATVMTFPARSWQTWVNNWAKRNAPGSDGTPPGYKFLGVGEDGRPRYAKDQRTNVYR